MRRIGELRAFAFKITTSPTLHDELIWLLPVVRGASCVFKQD